MKWVNCNDVIFDLSKVTYIEFEYNEADIPQVIISFAGTDKPLVMEGDSMEELITYFQSLTIDKNND